MWTARARALLEEWGVPLQSEVQAVRGGYHDYKARITSLLEARCVERWNQCAGQHTASMPYPVYQQGPSDVLREIRQVDLPWQVLCAVRGWCKARTGSLALSVKQSCIFCGAEVRAPMVHVFGVGGAWEEEQEEFRAAAEQREASPADWSSCSFQCGRRPVVSLRRWYGQTR